MRRRAPAFVHLALPTALGAEKPTLTITTLRETRPSCTKTYRGKSFAWPAWSMSSSSSSQPNQQHQLQQPLVRSRTAAPPETAHDFSAVLDVATPGTAAAGATPAWELMRREARAAAAEEPLLASFMFATVLNHRSLPSALAFHLANKLASSAIPATQLMRLFTDVLAGEVELAGGAKDHHHQPHLHQPPHNPPSNQLRSSGLVHQDQQQDQQQREADVYSDYAISADANRRSQLAAKMEHHLRLDILAVMERDPACNRFIDCLCYYKGFHALQAHRIAHELWCAGKVALAYHLQSQVSKELQVDIHPAAVIGPGAFFDHATGVVIGETCTIGKNFSMLHQVTLGGSGSKHGVRHPQIGDGVLIGAGATILGNIAVGDFAQIGAGSLVLEDVPKNSTVVGVPARVVNRSDVNGVAGKVVPALDMKHDRCLGDQAQDIADPKRSSSGSGVSCNSKPAS
jgi:serine O-acetyltransferase